MLDGGVTDPEGDRGLSPGKQAAPNLYLHIIDQNREWIMVHAAYESEKTRSVVRL